MILGRLSPDVVKALARKQTRTTRKCYLYIICEGGSEQPVKIGIASSITGRLSSMQTGSPRKLTVVKQWELDNRKVALSLEARIHADLSNVKLGNEWFNVSCAEAVGICKRRISNMNGTA